MLYASLAIAAVSFLLGSIPTGYLLIRFLRHEDIRTVGSGNIGATNVLRSGGKSLGIATFLGDVLKGTAAVWLGTALAAWMTSGLMPVREAEAVAAVAAVLGHMFTPWLGFKGGKGVATGFGVFLAASPLAALAAIAVFFVVVFTTRYVSLASILGSISFPLFAWFLIPGQKPALFVAAEFVVAGLIVVKHYQNIGRLLKGTESKIGKKKTA